MLVSGEEMLNDDNAAIFFHSWRTLMLSSLTMFNV